MANHKSAIKAHEQSLRRRDRNNRMKSRMRRAIRATRSTIGTVASQDDESASTAREAIRATSALVDKLAGKGIIHRNAAARHKSRLAKRLQRASAPSQDS
jgi:small subunit ribosomal protein S20